MWEALAGSLILEWPQLIACVQPGKTSACSNLGRRAALVLRTSCQVLYPARYPEWSGKHLAIITHDLQHSGGGVEPQNTSTRRLGSDFGQPATAYLFSDTPSAPDAEHDTVAYAPVEVCSATTSPSTVILQLTDPVSSAPFCAWRE